MTKKILIIGLLAAVFSCGLVAAVNEKFDNSAGLSAVYSDIGTGASASGMANAYLGACEDAVSIFWNPAGLANMKRKEKEWNMFFSNNMLFMDMMVETLSVAKSFKNNGVIALGLSYFNAGDMQRFNVDSSNAPISSTDLFSDYSLVGSIAYANALDKDMDFGITIKYFVDDMDGDMASTFAFDAGVRYFFSPLKGLSFNLLCKNFGGQLNNSIISKEVSFGALYSFSIADWGINAAYDLIGKLKNKALHRAGIEIKTPYLVVVRGGYFTDNTGVTEGFRNITLGLGLNLKNIFSIGDASIDVAFEPYGTLGNQVKTSFGVDF